MSADAGRGGPSSSAARSARYGPLLTAADLASLMGLKNRRAALRFVRRNRIPHAWLGRRWLVSRRQLIAFVEEKAVQDLERYQEQDDRLRDAAARLRGARQRATALSLDRSRR